MESLCLEVRGDYACFTRPELKVERVSYDVMTPSAARAVFEAVLWKPAICWDVERIAVLRPIQWASIRRNEVGSKVPTHSVETLMALGTGSLALWADDDRQQRAAVVLRDIAYRIWARLALTEKASPDDTLIKYVEMFRRRATKGQCVNQPYLGCREFACAFELVEDPASGPPPIDESRDLGIMLYDLDFAERGAPKPLFFRANLDHGVLAVPWRESPEVLA
jgi:CRISPR-associated protein Cas5d